jgi:hypothetical protein
MVSLWELGWGTCAAFGKWVGWQSEQLDLADLAGDGSAWRVLLVAAVGGPGWLVKGSGGVGAGEGERCPCKVALMEWVPRHANPQNNAGGTSGVLRLTHCVPYSAGVMHGRDMEALTVSMCCTVVSLFMTTKCIEAVPNRAPW